MYFQRYYLDCLSHASYMIADETTKVAAIVDPQRDIDIYLADAREHGFEIEHVILTHFHADFVAGHIELREAVGARIYLGARAEAEFDFQRLGSSDKIVLGGVRLEALETPGHTPEGITLLVFDRPDSQTPSAALTGDTLFIGDVGRPDLLASIGVTADELAEMLYDSLHNKLLKLPDETLVYPAHGAGSMCGKALSEEASSTIGEQRRFNYALQPMSLDEFKTLIEADQPEAPGYFVHDAILNRQERSSLEVSMADTLRGLELDEVLSLQDAGAQIVDTRDPIEFAATHLRGAFNIGIEGKYATWAGTILQKELPVVVIAEPDRIAESIMRLGRIGFDNVAGYLQKGMATLQNRPELWSHITRITAAAVGDLAGSTAIIDVRSAKEWEAGHIQGSLNLPLPHLAERVTEIPVSDHLIVHCQGGYRSAIAASLLQKLRHGEKVFDLVGGYKAWVQSGLPFVDAASV